MEPRRLSESVNHSPAFVLSELFNYGDMPRTRVFQIVEFFNIHLRNPDIVSFFHQLVERLKFLGENSGNSNAYRTMIEIILRPFDKFKTESKFLNYIEEKGSYIPP